MMIVGSHGVPSSSGVPRVGVTGTVVLLYSRTAEAPAASACRTLSAKEIVPRWTTATHVPAGAVPQSLASNALPQSTNRPVMPSVADENSAGVPEYVVEPTVTSASRPCRCGKEERFSTPGPTRSSCAPVFENDARWLSRSTAPTVTTLWYAPGNETFLDESLPEATTISVPLFRILL